MVGKSKIAIPIIKNNPKVFVLDTNIILHDYCSIYNFQENNLVIPIAVIEELDKFKKGDNNLSFNARGFIREIDRLSTNSFFEKGVSLGKGRGTIKVELNHPFPDSMKGTLSEDIPDHRIIATAYWIKETSPEKKVVLITKDMNMRLKARALGLMVQDYLNDKVKEERIERTSKEVQTLTKLSPEAKAILEKEGKVSVSSLGMKKRPSANQLYRVRGDVKTNTLARYDKKTDSIVKINSEVAYSITPRNEEQILALDAVLNPDIKVVSLTGNSGAGKTLMALAGALAQADRYDKILLSRPIVPMIGQNGERENTLPLFDNLSIIKNIAGEIGNNPSKIDEMIESGKLTISSLSYIRGRSLSGVFFIVDEAQNLTPHEIKTIITRAGEGTKIVFTGDIFQIDQPYLDIHSNGLVVLGEKFSGQAIFEHVNLMKGERSELARLAGKLL